MKERTRENWAAALRSGAIMAALIFSVVALLVFTNTISYLAGAVTCEDIPSLRTEVFNWISNPAEPALNTQVTYSHPVIRYRNQSAFNVDVSATESLYSAIHDSKAHQDFVLGG